VTCSTSALRRRCLKTIWHRVHGRAKLSLSSY
jgi:hypothetical protein